MSPRPLPLRPSLAPDRNPARPLLAARFRQALRAQAREFALEVEFQAAPGFTILFGPSGAGKTTLLDCVAGLGHARLGTHRTRRPRPIRCRTAHRSSRGEAARRIRLSKPRPVSASDGGAECAIRPHASAAGGAGGTNCPQFFRHFEFLISRGTTRERSLAEKASARRWREPW